MWGGFPASGWLGKEGGEVGGGQTEETTDIQLVPESIPEQHIHQSTCYVLN